MSNKPVYHADLAIPKSELDHLNKLLTMTGDEIYDKYGLKRDETITNTMKFEDGCELDVKVVICADEATPYVDLVLFNKNGCEIACTMAEDIEGEVEFETKDAIYKGIVKALERERFAVSVQQNGVYQVNIVEASSDKAAEDFLRNSHPGIRICGTRKATPGDMKPGMPILSAPDTSSLTTTLQAAASNESKHASEAVLFREDRSGTRMGKPGDANNIYYADWFKFYSFGLDGTPRSEGSALNFKDPDTHKPVPGGNDISEVDVVEAFRKSNPGKTLVMLSIEPSKGALEDKMKQALEQFKKDGQALLKLSPYKEGVYAMKFYDAKEDVINYLKQQDDNYFLSRNTTRDTVLSDTDLIDHIASEHLACVTRFDCEREWSVKDACDVSPGILKQASLDTVLQNAIQKTEPGKPNGRGEVPYEK